MTTEHPLCIGIDVSKAELAIYDGSSFITVVNTTKQIKAWLKTLTGPARIAVEATGTYHLQVLEQASRKGHALFVVDGFRLNRYRDSVGGRAKTDLADAKLLWRYLRHEYDHLRPWVAPPPGYARLKRLLNRRAKLVKMGVAVRQSLAGVPELRTACRSLLERLDRLLASIDRLLQHQVEKSGLQDQIKRVGAIEGIGKLNATALTTAYLRGAFRSSDAFIAFLGLDVRIRDSGRQRGRRKLTKQGDSETRRLLHNAAMAASRRGRWHQLHQANLARGLTRIQSLVIVARKLARLAFALLKSGAQYRPQPT
ncbi:transposase [Luteimonas sp. RD2P54]|uniref:Transposase n=1 Tax=Luteimonas endophytica TaxID=3042023 RepID=A0ABT6JAU8_9GAMM|nr:transposase [Luteimonas endophytica]MDH5822316.1 transposase [Luteimonas endophytica]MDH5822404.1 transposase [Luteimonas endophytica]MDH5823952.1 transposase [Luteimonas endophytica]MDH5824786.1 transposase [Luteimonas endophytica]